MANAQWTQMGPGAGGQEKAVFLWPHGGLFDFYVGSDVSGVWRAPDIGIADLSNPDKYIYQYISNHTMMRFVNKLHHPTSYTSNFLFVANRGGVERVDLLNTANPIIHVPMVNAGNVLINNMPVPFSEENCWVSDMHITDDVTHKIYFTTGNNRVSNDIAHNSKDANLNDFYWGTLKGTEDEIDLNSAGQIAGASFGLNGFRDVYCLYVDDNPQNQYDEIWVGTDKGLFHFSESDLTSNNLNLSSFLVPDPYGLLQVLDYKVTSIQPSPITGHFFVTINNGIDGTIDNNNVHHYGGLYDYDGVNSLIKINTPAFPVTKNNGGGSYTYTKEQFNQLLTLKTGSTINGYLAVNEDNTTGIQFHGVFYCGANVNGMPNGNWTALDAWGPTHDFGWNTSRPAANPFGCLLTPDNHLIIGKSGNIFVTKNSVINDDVEWQQIYTTTYANPPQSCTDTYADRGYVNTANKSVYAMDDNNIWIGQLDRVLFNSKDGGVDFHELGTNTSCYDILQPTWTPTCYSTSSTTNTPPTKFSFSDCFFVTNNTRDEADTKIYAGIAEGYATHKGAGFVFALDNPQDLTWEATQQLPICGDPIKMLFGSNGTRYAIINIENGPNDFQNRLFFFDGTIWNPINLNFGNPYNIVDAVLSPDGTKLYIYDKLNGFIVFNGSYTTWTQVTLSIPQLPSNVVPEKLALVPCNNNKDYNVICGTHPTLDNNAVQNLFHIYEWKNTYTNPVVKQDPLSFGTEFQYLNHDAVDHIDEGVTAIEVDETNHKIYAATVRNTGTAIFSHMYCTNYNLYSGSISPVWTEIIGNPQPFPNKTISFLKAYGRATCNEKLFICSRGLGTWVDDVPNTTIIDQLDFDNGLITTTGTINTDINISNIVDLDAATINIEAGYTITVNSGGVLNIMNGSHLYSCSGMWQGIINNGGTVNIQESLIEDAEEALRMDAPNSTAEITNSTFNKNFVDIVLDGQGFSNGISFSNSLFEDNTFKCNAALNTPHPQSFERTWANFMLTNATDVTINTNNNFSDASYAVNGTNSVAIIENNTFTNLGNNNNSVQHEYSAINMREGNLIATSNNFNNCNMGIVTTGAVTSVISLNTIAACEYGVSINGLYEGTSWIHHNTIEKTNNAIELWNISTQEPITVELNICNSAYDANNTPTSHCAIQFLQPFAYPTQVNIASNVITDYHFGVACIGAYGNAAMHNIVTENTINYLFEENEIGNDNYYGVYTEGCNYIALHGNTFDWLDKAADPTAYASQVQGIRAQTTINSSIDNNTMVQTGTGILMQDDCSNTFISCNYFDNAAPGIFMDNVDLPTQGTANTPTYNTWVGPYNGTLNNKFKIAGNSATGPIIFWYDGAANSTNQRWPRPSPPNLINPLAITALSLFYCNGMPNIIVLDSTAQERLVDTTVASNSIVDSLREYYREAYSYASMSEDSSLLSNSLRLAFYQQKQLENIGRFNEIMDMLRVGSIDSALLLTNNIIDNNAVEENLKQYYQILLPTLKPTPILPNANDSVTMENIIYQNAYEGGEAVIKIRAYLRKIMVDHHAGFMRNSNTVMQKAKQNIYVFPSPLTGSQHLNVVSKETAIATISIYDVTGKIMFQTIIDGFKKETEINCSAFAPGVYHIKVISTDTYQYNTTFIIF